MEELEAVNVADAKRLEQVFADRATTDGTLERRSWRFAGSKLRRPTDWSNPTAGSPMSAPTSVSIVLWYCQFLA
jgi:hypothetical protein